jgi:hypothetical protein
MSDPKYNGDGSYKVVVPKVNKVIQNINEVMPCLEHLTENEHLHMLCVQH